MKKLNKFHRQLKNLRNSLLLAQNTRSRKKNPKLSLYHRETLYLEKLTGGAPQAIRNRHCCFRRRI